jgi:hypothetical protein
MRRTIAAALGALVAVALMLHVPELIDPQELLYTCHVATMLVAMGLLAGLHRLVATGFLFHLAVGLPSWLLDAVARGTTWTSTLAHLVPLFAGAWAVRQDGLPRRTPIYAWSMFVACSVVSFFLTDPALNVNVVHAPWPPTAILGREGTWLVHGLLSITFLVAAERLWRLILGRNALHIDHRAL